MAKRKLNDGVKRNIIDSAERLVFMISQKNIRDAKPCDGKNCVVAQALRTLFGLLYGDVLEVIVGSAITKIRTKDRVIRYGTSSALRHALKRFDETFLATGKGEWDLEPGEYHLLPFPKSYKREYGRGPGNRFHLIKPKAERKGKKSTYQGRKIPARNIINARSWAKAA